MSQILHKPQSLSKHKCCNAHLKPLMERVNTLQHKLLVETERREKEYNQLLHILLTLKNIKNKQQQLNQTKQHNKSKLRLTKEALDNKVNESKINRQSSSPKVTNKSKPLRRASQNAKKNETISPPIPSIVNKNKDEHIIQTLQRHQIELNKTKQLSNYLMQQLLILFEKAKEFQPLQHSNIEVNKIVTQQTLNSMVFDPSNKFMNNDSNVSFGQKIQKMQQIILKNNTQISRSHDKIIEHENMLSDLITLTRSLSSQMVKVPLYLQPHYLENNH